MNTHLRSFSENDLVSIGAEKFCEHYKDHFEAWLGGSESEDEHKTVETSLNRTGEAVRTESIDHSDSSASKVKEVTIEQNDEAKMEELKLEFSEIFSQDRELETPLEVGRRKVRKDYLADLCEQQQSHAYDDTTRICES